MPRRPDRREAVLNQFPIRIGQDDSTGVISRPQAPDRAHRHGRRCATVTPTRPAEEPSCPKSAQNQIRVP
ncbi:hypothetical protein BN2537_4051 [Streptomyces venezuelae]|nr:hypothetical protein BN2537_4051 [Streptomyces venezuelae]